VSVRVRVCVCVCVGGGMGCVCELQLWVWMEFWVCVCEGVLREMCCNTAQARWLAHLRTAVAPAWNTAFISILLHVLRCIL